MRDDHGERQRAYKVELLPRVDKAEEKRRRRHERKLKKEERDHKSLKRGENYQD